MMRSSLSRGPRALFHRPLVLIGLLALPVTALTASAQNTWRVSGSGGAEGNDTAYTAALSKDGRIVAFASDASNLVPGDTNGERDVFVHDRRTGQVSRVSVDSAGIQGNGRSNEPALSGDGRLVAFSSYATNLVGGDTNGTWDVFVHDRQTGITQQVSVDSNGVGGDGWAIEPAFSSNGLVVAFASDSTNLVSGDGNADFDVFTHDLTTGTTTRISVDSAGGEAQGSSFRPSLSADGRLISFQSDAADLVSGDTNGRNDVFVHDRQSGATTRVSVDSSGTQGAGTSQSGRISADGTCVVFDSIADNLVNGDTNWDWDVFVHERATGITTRVSVDSSGGQANSFSFAGSLSADGRDVAFYSMATNLLPKDLNGAMDVFLHDRVTGATTPLSVSNAGELGDGASSLPVLSEAGRFVAFESYATNLVSGDTNGAQDIFVHGPHLTLEADPEVVVAGSSLSFATWGGQPSGLALLAAVDLNGSPLFARVLSGSFTGSGEWTFAGTVPPSLAGNVITFLGFGFAPSGKAELTNLEVVTIQ